MSFFRRFIILAAAAALFQAQLAAQVSSPARISVLGDSYSTFEGWVKPSWNAVWYFPEGSRRGTQENDVRKVEQTWWHLVIKEMGATLEKNNSFSGATICYTGYPDSMGRHQDYSDRSFIARAADLGSPDIILVCGGTNDSWCGAPVGEYRWNAWTNEELHSFRPAMAKMCSDLKDLYPQARIVFMLNSELRDEINDSVHEICRHYNIECVDLQNIDKQKGHPSQAGMKAIASQVVARLRTPWTASVPKQGPVLRYDFARSSGTTVRDISGSGMNGNLCGSAKIERFDGKKVVNLGNDKGYIDMGPEVGRILANSRSFTVSVKYLVDETASLEGQGYFLWAFSTMELNTTTQGRYHAYKLNIQRSENSIGGWKYETLMDIGRPSAKGTWQHAVYTQDGHSGKLYLNGRLVAFDEDMFSMDSVFPDGETPLYNWIGRAPFAGDHYLAGTYVSDVRVWNRALGSNEVSSLNAELMPDMAAFIREMYEEGLFEDYAFLKKHCTREMLSKLSGEYEAEYDGKGYAVWLFRSGAQDSIGDQDGIVSISNLGDGWYRYDGVDGGTKFSRRIKLSLSGDKVVIEDLEDA